MIKGDVLFNDGQNLGSNLFSGLLNQILSESLFKMGCLVRDALRLCHPVSVLFAFLVRLVSFLSLLTCI